MRKKRSQLAIQRPAHLPHHGVPPCILRSLQTIGVVDLLPIDLYIDAVGAIASARFFPIAELMLARVNRGAAATPA